MILCACVKLCLWNACTVQIWIGNPVIAERKDDKQQFLSSNQSALTYKWAAKARFYWPNNFALEAPFDWTSCFGTKPRFGITFPGRYAHIGNKRQLLVQNLFPVYRFYCTNGRAVHHVPLIVPSSGHQCISTCTRIKRKICKARLSIYSITDSHELQRNIFRTDVMLFV